MTPQLRERWKHLAPRERTLLIIGGAITVMSLFFVLAVDPLLSTLDRLNRQAAKKHKESAELEVLAQEYAVKQARLAASESRMPSADSGFSLLAFLEDAATTAHIRDRIAGMQPQQQALPQGYQETAVDLRLEGVQMPELLALLREIEQAPYDLQVRHFQVRPKYDNPVNLDATIRVLSYVKG